MTNSFRILAFSGSARTGSLNRKLLAITAEGAVAVGAHVSFINLRDLEIPIYDGDLEVAEGIPAGAVEFRDALLGHDAMLIASVEHNGSVSALLKNALDWASRPSAGIDGPTPFRGKPAALVGTSPGLFGAVRSLNHLRAILSKLGANVIGQELALPNALQAFDESGKLLCERAATAARSVGASLARMR